MQAKLLKETERHSRKKELLGTTHKALLIWPPFLPYLLPASHAHALYCVLHGSHTIVPWYSEFTQYMRLSHVSVPLHKLFPVPIGNHAFSDTLPNTPSYHLPLIYFSGFLCFHSILSWYLLNAKCLKGGAVSS